MSRKRIFSFLVGLIFLALTGAADEPSPVLARFNQQQRQDLLAGKAIYQSVRSKDEAGNLQGHGEGIALINADVDKCFKLFCDFNRQAQYFPRKKLSQIIKQEGNVYHVQKEFGFYVKDIRYVVEYTVDEENHTVKFRMLKDYPHDLKESEGFFRFEKLEAKRTLFTYAVTKVDTGLAVPKFIQDYLSSKDLPAVVENAKKFIESDGKWKKE